MLKWLGGYSVICLESRPNDLAGPIPLPTLSDRDIEDLSPAEKDEQALLVKERQRMLAVAFRDFMTTGQLFEVPNANRRRFFDKVIEIAAKVCSLVSLPFQRVTSGCLEVHERMRGGIKARQRPSIL